MRLQKAIMEVIRQCEKSMRLLAIIASQTICRWGGPYLVNTCFEESPGFDAPAPILNGFVVELVGYEKALISRSNVELLLSSYVTFNARRKWRVLVAARVGRELSSRCLALAEALFHFLGRYRYGAPSGKLAWLSLLSPSSSPAHLLTIFRITTLSPLGIMRRVNSLASSISLSMVLMLVLPFSYCCQLTGLGGEE